jgi:hypothetical protein
VAHDDCRALGSSQRGYGGVELVGGRPHSGARDPAGARPRRRILEAGELLDVVREDEVCQGQIR